MRTKTLSALLAAAALATANLGLAQEQATTQTATPETVSAVVAPPATPAARPSRGATMDSVRNKFGAPMQEAPSIGTPPITRWEYPGYVVFFENDKVLHTVVMRDSSAS